MSATFSMPFTFEASSTQTAPLMGAVCRTASHTVIVTLTPSIEPLLLAVIGHRKNLKVFRTVVQFVTVNVMNHFIATKRTTKSFGRYKSMNSKSFPGNRFPDHQIATVDIWLSRISRRLYTGMSLRKALHRTVVGFSLFDATGRRSKRFTTMDTSSIHSVAFSSGMTFSRAMFTPIDFALSHWKGVVTGGAGKKDFCSHACNFIRNVIGMQPMTFATSITRAS